MKSIACGVLLTPLVAMATGYLENPQPGSTQSGISIISGWHCTASEIEIKVDGVSIGGTGVGSVRDDAISVCGHNQSGYAVLYNYNIPAPGEHTIQVYADGALLETRKFRTVRSGGVPFLQGMAGTVDILDFPYQGGITTIEWSEAKQSFVVIGSRSNTTNPPPPPPPPPPSQPEVDLSSLNNKQHVQTIAYIYQNNACSIYDVQLNKVFVDVFTIQSISESERVQITAYDASSRFVFDLRYIGGNLTMGFDFTGTVVNSITGERGSVTANSVKYDRDDLGFKGFVSIRMENGCNITMNL